MHPTGQAGAEDEREQVQTGHVGGSLHNTLTRLVTSNTSLTGHTFFLCKFKTG